MRNPVIAAACLATSFAFAGCATIKSQGYIAQPLAKPLQAGVGGVVIHVDKKRNLENVFGRADLYGRKTNEGFAELRFMGIRDGQIVLRRIDISVLSNETTMSRTGVYLPSSSTSQTTGAIGSTPFSATTSTSGPGVYIPPKPSTTVVLPPNAIEFVVTPGQAIPFEGFTVTVTGSSPASLNYVIAKSE